MTTPTPSRAVAAIDKAFKEQTGVVGEVKELTDAITQLERDLAAAQEELAAAKELIGPIPRSVVIDGLTTQLAAAQEALNQMGAAMREARQRAEAAERERDEANDKAVRVLRGEFAQICSYCGWESFDGNADAQPEAAWNALQSHIRKCAKHPLVQAEADRDEWKRKAEESARDAARYRWLREFSNHAPSSYPAIRIQIGPVWDCKIINGEKADAAIDAAIAAKGEA